MKTRFILLAAATCLTGVPVAADTSSNARLEAAKSAAASRYADDKKLCAEESSSSTRMQCLRDAKAEYDSALVRAGKEHEQPTSSSKICTGCGKVLSVKIVEKAGESGAVGMVAGGVAGALLGNQIGKGASRDIATIAGAAGGAYAGHKIEQQVKSVKKWEVMVRFDQGEEKAFLFDKDPGFAPGAAVKSSGSSIVPR